MQRLLPLQKVVWDEEVYPRCAYNWQTAYDYAQSLKAGAKFPPIIVGLFRKKHILIDGKHRLEAHRQNKQTHIQTQILKGLSKKELFAEAVRRNIGHGRQFSPFEKAKIVVKLQELDYNLPEISKIVNIPMDKITDFVGKKITNSITGEIIVLKAPMKHLKGKKVPMDFDDTQHIFSTRSQDYLVSELLYALENNLIDKNNLKVIGKLEKIAKLIRKL